MKEIDKLEIHAWHACNLSCESCSHYSSLNVKGGPSLDDCDKWMANWSKIVIPKTFSILGGEPTLNRDLESIVERAIYYWPETTIQLVTNGFFLHRHPNLPSILAKSNKTILIISSHHDAVEYQDKLKPVEELLLKWISDFKINVHVRDSAKFWTRRYKNTDRIYSLFDSDPYEAWKVCSTKYCVQLFENKLWKCPAITYFKLVEKKFTINDKTRDLIKQYKPLNVECTEKELNSFFEKREEEICKICPEKLEHFELPVPLKRNRN